VWTVVIGEKGFRDGKAGVIDALDRIITEILEYRRILVADLHKADQQ